GWFHSVRDGVVRMGQVCAWGTRCEGHSTSNSHRDLAANGILCTNHCALRSGGLSRFAASCALQPIPIPGSHWLRLIRKEKPWALPSWLFSVPVLSLRHLHALALTHRLAQFVTGGLPLCVTFGFALGHLFGHRWMLMTTDRILQHLSSAAPLLPLRRQ